MLTLLQTVVIYFFFPETKGYTLEELSTLFEDPDVMIEGLENADSGMSVENITPNPSIKDSKD